MSYLIETNCLSELRRRTPNPNVAQWFSKRPSRATYLSVLSVGEFRKGAESAKDASLRASLLDWLELELPAFYRNRLLAIDQAVADQWGLLCAAAGRPLPVIDGLLAATALVHRLTIVTRNVKDFEGLGVQVLNPWLE